MREGTDSDWSKVSTRGPATPSAAPSGARRLPPSARVAARAGVGAEPSAVQSATCVRASASLGALEPGETKSQQSSSASRGEDLRPGARSVSVGPPSASIPRKPGTARRPGRRGRPRVSSVAAQPRQRGSTRHASASSTSRWRAPTDFAGDRTSGTSSGRRRSARCPARQGTGPPPRGRAAASSVAERARVGAERPAASPNASRSPASTALGQPAA